MTFFLLRFGPAMVGVLIAATLTYLARRSFVPLPPKSQLLTVIGMAAGIGLMITYRAWSVFPWWLPPIDSALPRYLQLLGFIAPLGIGVAALIFLCLPDSVTERIGHATLAPRTAMTFVPKRWFSFTVAVAVAAIVTAVLAGLASTRDEDGRYTMYRIDLNADTSSATSIYGWWFSIPCLAAIALITVQVLIGLLVISRPAPAVDARLDSARRTARIRNILAVSSGALLLHLAAVLQSLANSSTMITGLQTGTHGTISVGTSFAAMGPALGCASLLALVGGFTLWWFVLGSALPARSRNRQQSMSA